MMCPSDLPVGLGGSSLSDGKLEPRAHVESMSQVELDLEKVECLSRTHSYIDK